MTERGETLTVTDDHGGRRGEQMQSLDERVSLYLRNAFAIAQHGGRLSALSQPSWAGSVACE